MVRGRTDKRSALPGRTGRRRQALGGRRGLQKLRASPAAAAGMGAACGRGGGVSPSPWQAASRTGQSFRVSSSHSVCF